ncbi:MAG: TlpA family protein disulfide reductase [Deltaproteobacteria bacterium]|nr:TlpA family protein disulfide reductase [Deltaproteobacteria bacterium]
MPCLSLLRFGCLAAGVLVAAGCGKPGNPAPTAEAQTGRVAAVAENSAAGPAKAAAIDPALLAGFCDKHWPGEGAGTLDFGKGPGGEPLAGANAGTGGYRWINFWATWCKPCVEEMPMLGRWRDALVKDGTDFSLELWSVDEDREALDAAVAKGLPGGAFLTTADKLGDWLEGFGLPRDAVLPVHALVDPAGKLRCVRLGSVRVPDYGKVRALVGR